MFRRIFAWEVSIRGTRVRPMGLVPIFLFVWLLAYVQPRWNGHVYRQYVVIEIGVGEEFLAWGDGIVMCDAQVTKCYIDRCEEGTHMSYVVAEEETLNMATPVTTLPQEWCEKWHLQDVQPPEGDWLPYMRVPTPQPPDDQRA